MTNLSHSLQSLDDVVKLGLLAGLVVVILFMGLIVAFLILQQRRLRLLEEALSSLARPEVTDPVSPVPESTDSEAEPKTDRAPDLRADAGTEGTQSADVPPAGQSVVETGDPVADAPKTVPARLEVDAAAGRETATVASRVVSDVVVTSARSDDGKAEPVADDSPGPTLSTGGTASAIAPRSEGKIAPSRAKPSVQTREGLRERLGSAQALLRSLEGEDSPLELNRKLAYLQAEVSAMRGADVLDLPAAELNDVLGFQAVLKDFIATRHDSGLSHENPSAFAVAEVQRLEKVVNNIAACVAENLSVGRVGNASAKEKNEIPGIQFNEHGTVETTGASRSDVGFGSEVSRVESVIQGIESFVGEQLHIGRDLVTGEGGGLTRERLRETLERANDAFGHLVERQHELAAGFLNHDLTLVDGQVDISPDLVGFCRHRNPDSPLLAPQRPALCQFANGEGIYHAEVVTHLETVRASCRDLMAQHEEQAERVKEAKTLADQGRFDDAEKMLANINPAFSDLASDGVREQIEGWRRKLSDLEERFALLKKLLETPWERPFAQPWKVIRREEQLLSHAQEFEESLEKFRLELNESGNEDFVAEGVQVYHRLADQLNELANTFTAQSTDAKISTLLHFALIAESVLGWLYAHPESRPVIVWTLAMLGGAFVIQHFHRWLLRRTTVEFGLESNGKPLEERDLAQVYLNNKPYASGDRIAPGRYQLTLDSSIFEPVTQRVRIRYGRRNKIGSIPVRLSRDTYVNSLEMKFVPVGGTTVMFGVWPTRVRDFRFFTRERGLRWKRPRFKQDDLHPAVNVSWEDARAFCAWLTERERTMGRIGPRDEYRLPTDLEWSAACELGPERGDTPRQRSGRVKDHYPWGPKWPPSRDSGNLDPTLKSDPYDFTCKVGMFKPNRQGLYDLAGNVWEWCEDLHEGKGKTRTLRGGSWHTASQEMLLSSCRLGDSPGHRVDIIGFRCVLEVRKPSPLFRPAMEQQL